jgi:hypothetical protein
MNLPVSKHVENIKIKSINLESVHFIGLCCIMNCKGQGKFAGISKKPALLEATK